MSNNEKLLDLLSKSHLSADETMEINSLISKDPEIKDLYNAYNLIKNNIKKHGHPSFDELNDFVLCKNDMEPEDLNAAAKVPVIEDHIRRCTKCNKLYLELDTELNDTDSFLKENMYASSKEKSKTIGSFISPSFNKFRFAYSSLAIASLLLLGVIFTSYFTTPETYRIAEMGNNSELYVTRGRATDDFQQSLQAIENKEYEQAEKLLLSDIKNNSGDETIFYSNYILGLTYLQSSEKEFVGLFKSYDHEKVNKGIKYLLLSIEKNNSGKYPNIRYDADFYIAKGYLMLNNKEKAKLYLNKVIDSKGGKMEDAQNMLSDLK